MLVLMQDVDEVHQILRRAVAARRREEAGALIAPRAVERMLHDRQEFDVREVHLAHVLGERSGQLAIASSGPVSSPRTTPRSEVHFVDRHRRGEGVALRAVAHPLAVLPFVIEVPDHRGGFAAASRA